MTFLERELPMETTTTHTGMIPVQLIRINEESEIAVILEEGEKVHRGVNLWQVEGHERRSDGLRSWRYRITGKLSAAL